MATVTKVQGLEELKATLAKLPIEIGRKVLRQGTSAGAAKLKGFLKAEVPQRTGTLQRSAIIKFVRENSNDTQAVYIVTFRRGKKAQARSATSKKTGKTRQVANKDAFYASYVEFGHKVVPRKSKGGGQRPSGRTRVEGKHYLRDSFQKHQDDAIEAMKAGLTKALLKLPEFK